MHCTGSTPARRRVGLRPTLMFVPLLMSLHEQGFDGLPVRTGVEFGISFAMGKVRRRIVIGMR